MSSAFHHRYARHIALPEVGEEGQRRLRAAKVLVVGAGGLGSPVLLYLAAAGVGHLGVIDPDRVSLSNLQRQILYGEADVEREKTRATADRLQELNQEVGLALTTEALTAENAAASIAGYHVVVDCSDNFATRYAINDACLKLGVPWVCGAIGRFSGYVSVFDATSACYRCFHPDAQDAEEMRCDTMGVLGALPGIFGSVQAMETLKILLGVGTTLAGRLWRYDALTGEARITTLERDISCVCNQATYCSDKRSTL